MKHGKLQRILAVLIVVTALTAAVFPVAYPSFQSANGQNAGTTAQNSYGNAAVKTYLNDFLSSDKDVLTVENGTAGVRVSLSQGNFAYAYAFVPSSKSGSEYLVLSYSAEDVSFKVSVKYDGVDGEYVSSFTATGKEEKATIILNREMSVFEVRVYPDGSEKNVEISFGEIYLYDYYESYTIANNERVDKVSGFSDDKADTHTTDPDDNGEGSQGDNGGNGNGEDNQGNSGSGETQFGPKTDPSINDNFDDEAYFSGGGQIGNGNQGNQGNQSGNGGKGDNGGSYGGDVPHIDYDVNDDSPISTSERLCNKYSELFSIGMTAGYERYASYAELEGHFDSFTCENEMKMYTIASDENENFNYKDASTYDFSKADEMLIYMRGKGKKIRGHCLLWYQDAPKWIANCKDKELLLDMIDTYCYIVVRHFTEKFGDVVYCWDVVNEAVSDNFGGEKLTSAACAVLGTKDDGCNQMRSTFYSVAGLDYLVTAFKAARRANGKAKLYYNDYNLCAEHQKLRGVVNLVTRLIEAGAPIDGVGIQSHFKLNSSLIDKIDDVVLTLKRIETVTGRPIEIQVTELDVENYSNSDEALATFYGKVFAAYRSLAEYIECVTFWGVADDYSWLDVNEYRKAHPFIFDENKQKKSAFSAIFDF